MKKIYLMRHAKSSWDNANLTDHQRPLNPRGNRDIITITNQLKRKSCNPDIIYASDSNRTKQTSRYMLDNGLSGSLSFDADLYLASASELLSFIQNIKNDFESAMIVAHNPGISAAICGLANLDPTDLPTAVVASISFDVDNFKDIKFGKGSLEFLIYPKMFA